jgi:hypothetical protein
MSSRIVPASKISHAQILCLLIFGNKKVGQLGVPLQCRNVRNIFSRKSIKCFKI